MHANVPVVEVHSMKLPRLYWKASHPDWRWDSGEIARMVDDPVRVHFYTLESIRDEIEMYS